LPKTHERLDFSTLGSSSPVAQKAKLYESVNMIQLGAMPLPRFLSLHPEAKVTPADFAFLKEYLSPWAPKASPPEGAAPAPVQGPVSSPVSLAKIRPELDRFPFDPAFESWKPISFTDRGDNHTFRFVLGNDIAVKAAQSGHISPWPDGTRFAKVAWQQELGPDGMVYPGKFMQVEQMLKDTKRFKTTDGWGWGRWLSPELQPYGKDARFVNECTGCHMPVRRDDYVYTLPMTAALVNGEEVINRSAATLPADLPWQPLGWSAITMYVDARHHTMAVLNGNDTAMLAVHPRSTSGASGGIEYPSGAVLALVTWTLRDDPHWFGARIPDTPQSVEFVQITRAGNRYFRFAGRELSEVHSYANRAGRMDLILHLMPARLP
jgi:hypothetical protein